MEAGCRFDVGRLHRRRNRQRTCVRGVWRAASTRFTSRCVGAAPLGGCVLERSPRVGSAARTVPGCLRVRGMARKMAAGTDDDEARIERDARQMHRQGSVVMQNRVALHARVVGEPNRPCPDRWHRRLSGLAGSASLATEPGCADNPSRHRLSTWQAMEGWRHRNGDSLRCRRGSERSGVQPSCLVSDGRLAIWVRVGRVVRVRLRRAEGGGPAGRLRAGCLGRKAARSKHRATPSC